jgi:S-adenosylmethionine decarboxylase
MNGIEWIVEAHGCESRALADIDLMRALFARMIEDLGLRPVADTQWHQFPASPDSISGGITGLCLLAESHLACHTFPEHGSLCLNLFCCKPRPDWDFAGYLKSHFGAEIVEVRRLERAHIAVTAGARA